MVGENQKHENQVKDKLGCGIEVGMCRYAVYRMHEDAFGDRKNVDYEVHLQFIAYSK